MRAMLALAGGAAIKTSAVAAATPSAQKFNFPGGIVDLRWLKTSSQTPIVKFGLHDPIILEEKKHWRALVGISLDTLPGEYVLYVKDANSELPGTSLRFNVEQKLYPIIEVPEPLSTVRSLPKTLSSLSFNNSVPPTLPLRMPIDGDWDTNYGNIYTTIDNRSLATTTQYHAGFASDQIEMVTAPQNGIVCKIERNADTAPATVCIDHGRGLISVLTGISDLSVEVGNGIVAGAVIGRLKPLAENATVADSGTFSTSSKPQSQSNSPSGSPSAELTWSCIVNDVAVDPLILTQIT